MVLPSDMMLSAIVAAANAQAGLPLSSDNSISQSSSGGDVPVSRQNNRHGVSSNGNNKRKFTAVLSHGNNHST